MTVSLIGSALTVPVGTPPRKGFAGPIVVDVVVVVVV
jgi:hypothetical protein